jgi:hypothetical protein
VARRSVWFMVNFYAVMKVVGVFVRFRFPFLRRQFRPSAVRLKKLLSVDHSIFLGEFLMLIPPSI